MLVELVLYAVIFIAELLGTGQDKINKIISHIKSGLSDDDDDDDDDELSDKNLLYVFIASKTSFY